jgi:hypothetical protein
MGFNSAFKGLIGFTSEKLLEEASVDTLLYVDISSEFYCNMIDIFGLDSVWNNARLYKSAMRV